MKAFSFRAHGWEDSERARGYGGQIAEVAARPAVAGFGKSRLHQVDSRQAGCANFFRASFLYGFM
jgi:hypothetical protein